MLVRKNVLRNYYILCHFSNKHPTDVLQLASYCNALVSPYSYTLFVCVCEFVFFTDIVHACNLMSVCVCVWLQMILCICLFHCTCLWMDFYVIDLFVSIFFLCVACFFPAKL